MTEPTRDDEGRFVCTPERPWSEGDDTPAIHPKAREVGEQRDGWPAGDLQDMQCPICGTRWTKELPQ